MSTEVRFVLAMGLMLLVLVGTNILFPPLTPEAPEVPADSAAAPARRDLPELVRPTGPEGSEDAAGSDPEGDVVPAVPGDGAAAPAAGSPVRTVRVEGPLYRFDFSTAGARMVRAELPGYESLRSGNGEVSLLPRGGDALGHRLVVGQDTLDLTRLPFEVTHEEGMILSPGSGPRTLGFTYRHPTQPFSVELEYVFRPDSYLVDARGRVSGVDRPVLLTDLGSGLAFNEADSTGEARMMAWVGNHLEDGIRSRNLDGVDESAIEPGPFHWAAFKSKFFVFAILAGDVGEENDYLSAIRVAPRDGETRADVAVAQPAASDGSFDYRVFLGPQDYGRLQALGEDLQEVNPYGWRIFRPIIRPVVAIILPVLAFLHDRLNVGYGWVLIIFGVLMRVLLWPFYMKSMRAQMKNMALQPLVKEIQTKYKDKPEQMQKEMLKLHKEYGFNPLAGCLPMLLPWPVLIALFFVFQNSIEFRGVEFLWLPDLSAPDPLYLLPLFLAASMFLLQWISLRSMEQDNPQMKMMLWMMPLFMGFIFLRFASGLNLYYATANLATIPQQIIVANERKKARAKGPVKRVE